MHTCSNCSVKNCKKKRPAHINRKNVILLYDNGQPYTAKIIQKKILELLWSVLSRPPYSPDLAPTDFHLFRSLQNSLNGKNFHNDAEIDKFVKNFFASKPPKFFEEEINKLPSKWE